MDWHQKYDDALMDLLEGRDTGTFRDLLSYLNALYEREKENMVISNDVEAIQSHWMKANAVKELLVELKYEG